MWNGFVVGAGMIVVTTAVHATFMAFAIGGLHRWRDARPNFVVLEATVVIALLVLVMFAATVIEIWAWAALFYLNGAFTEVDSLEKAVYFTIVTYTTLGYGDIVLAPPNRIAAAVCAANGIIMFGWTTALVFAFINWVYRNLAEREGREI